MPSIAYNVWHGARGWASPFDRRPNHRICARFSAVFASKTEPPAGLATRRESSNVCRWAGRSPEQEEHTWPLRSTESPRVTRRNDYEAASGGSRPSSTRCRNRRPIRVRNQGASRALEDPVRQVAVGPDRPVLSDSGDRLPSPRAGFRRPPTFDPAPLSSGGRRDRSGKLTEEAANSKGPDGNDPDSRMARERSPGLDTRRWSVLQWEALPFALRSGTRDNRQQMVGTAVLRTKVAGNGE